MPPRSPRTMMRRIKLGIGATLTAGAVCRLPQPNIYRDSAGLDDSGEPLTITFHRNWQGARGRGTSATVNGGDLAAAVRNWNADGDGRGSGPAAGRASGSARAALDRAHRHDGRGQVVDRTAAGAAPRPALRRCRHRDRGGPCRSHHRGDLRLLWRALFP